MQFKTIIIVLTLFKPSSLLSRCSYHNFVALFKPSSLLTRCSNHTWFFPEMALPRVLFLVLFQNTTPRQTTCIQLPGIHLDLWCHILQQVNGDVSRWAWAFERPVSVGYTLPRSIRLSRIYQTRSTFEERVMRLMLKLERGTSYCLTPCWGRTQLRIVAKQGWRRQRMV